MMARRHDQRGSPVRAAQASVRVEVRTEASDLFAVAEGAASSPGGVAQGCEVAAACATCLPPLRRHQLVRRVHPSRRRLSCCGLSPDEARAEPARRARTKAGTRCFPAAMAPPAAAPGGHDARRWLRRSWQRCPWLLRRAARQLAGHIDDVDLPGRPGWPATVTRSAGLGRGPLHQFAVTLDKSRWQGSPPPVGVAQHGERIRGSSSRLDAFCDAAPLQWANVEPSGTARSLHPVRPRLRSHYARPQALPVLRVN